MQVMKAGEGDLLSRKQEQAIAALLATHTVYEAASKIGINNRTLREWLRRPGFAAAYSEAKKEIIRKTVERLEIATASAIIALQKQCSHDKPSVVYKAACKLLDSRNDSVNLVEVMATIREMQERLSKGGI